MLNLTHIFRLCNDIIIRSGSYSLRSIFFNTQAILLFSPNYVYCYPCRLFKNDDSIVLFSSPPLVKTDSSQ